LPDLLIQLQKKKRDSVPFFTASYQNISVSLTPKGQPCSLPDEWEHYKEQQEKVFAQKRAEREQKQQEWRQKTEDRIRKHEEKRDDFQRKLYKRESHLADLHTKLREVRSDNYRAKVSEWISEEESRISELRDKIRNIGNWLEEDRDKLRY
jgi:septal ring factor EnvC (AmiA/AmiB activator)